MAGQEGQTDLIPWTLIKPPLEWKHQLSGADNHSCHFPEIFMDTFELIKRC